jgi:hypothetical protein
MSYLGNFTKYLGIEFDQTPSSITIHQTTYASAILEHYGLDQCNPSKIPLTAGFTTSRHTGIPSMDPTKYRSLIGKLAFLTTTQPDIAFAINLLSHYNSAPQFQHLKAARQVLCYIRGMLGHGLTYARAPRLTLTGYNNAD